MKNKPPAAEQGTPTPGAQAVRRAMSVLRVVAGGAPQQGLRLKDVVAQVGLNAATVHRLLRVLTEEGAVDYDPVARVYRGGKELFLFGLVQQPGHFPIRQLAEPYTRRLAEASGETVSLIVRGNTDTVILDRKMGTGPVQVLAVAVGARMPMGLASGGVALLAGMPDAEAEEIMLANAKRYEARGTSVDKVRERVALARRQGYAFADPGLHPGTRSVSVTIEGRAGTPVAAFAIAAIRYRMPPTRVPELVAIMREMARKVTERLAVDRRGRPRG